jgi:hypothetical protein
MTGAKRQINPFARISQPAFRRLLAAASDLGLLTLLRRDFLRAFAAVDQEQHRHTHGQAVGHLLQNQ